MDGFGGRQHDLSKLDFRLKSVKFFYSLYQPHLPGYIDSLYNQLASVNTKSNGSFSYGYGTSYGNGLGESPLPTSTSSAARSTLLGRGWHLSDGINSTAEYPQTDEDISTDDALPLTGSFVEYFNDRFATNFMKLDLDSFYYRKTGHMPATCIGNGSSNDSLHLCGETMPIFNYLAIDSINNCFDNSFFATSKGTVKFTNYRDSINNQFDSLYRAKCLEAYKFEQFTVTHAVREYHYTLYYYDQAGNLVKTVPPEGVHPRYNTSFSDSVNQARINHGSYTPEHTLATHYRYNTLNQVVAQWTPDAALSKFWYDRLGRLVVSQNARQKANSGSETNRLYSYTQYDALGRITEVGEIKNLTTNAITDALARDNSGLGAWFTSSSTGKGQVTTTVYDQAYPGFTSGSEPIVQRNLRNRISYTSITKGNNPAQFDAATFYSYDIHGNVDTLVQDYGSQTVGLANIMNQNGNRWKKLTCQFDLISGKVNAVAYNPGKVDQFFHKYAYDAENRLVKVITSADGWVWEEDANYSYYLHGPLARTVLGQQMVQGIDYAYTLQGWLKGVNSFSNNAGIYDMGGDGGIGQQAQFVGRDAIGFGLNYFTGDYSPVNTGVTPFPGHSGLLPGGEYRPLYNGNISSMAVNIGVFNAPLLYNYRYDQLNRITGMDAYSGFVNNTNQWGTPINNGAYKERVGYDANGNILNYLRQGSSTKLGMDILTYSYNRDVNGLLTDNKLNHVGDQVTDAEYVEDMDSQAVNNYVYDPIGNLIRDNKAGIDSIEWTVYGKISQINKSNGMVIKYSYDAAGNRIGKSVSSADNSVSYTWYVRDASGNVMSTYSSSGSSATIPSLLTQTDVHLYGSSRLGVQNRYIDAKANLPVADIFSNSRGQKLFELSNHLGNVLATISDKKVAHSSNGTDVDYYEADVVTASDYYPFGMLMPGRQMNQGVNIPGATVTGNTVVNGYTVPVDLTLATRTGSLPSEYVASNSIEFSGEFESTLTDEFTAYISDAGYAGTGNLGSGLSGSGGSYRYGFNGQEMSNEIKGVGNSYTAEFWEYDPRAGRRWNVDPVIDPSESPYATNKNNPILFDDPEGDCPTCPKPEKDGKAEGDITTTSTRVFGARNSYVDKQNWHWHAGSEEYKTKAGWYNDADYQKALSGPAKDAAGFLGMYSNAVSNNGNWNDEQKANASNSKLARFLSDRNSDGFNFEFGKATTNAAREKNFGVTGFTTQSGFNVEDMVGLGLLTKGLLQMAGRKIIGSAQTTGTFGHAFTSDLIAWRYALDPRVSRVSLDLGYKRLLGLQTAPFKWGPRPDVGIFFKSGRVKVFEVMSRTDVESNLINRNVRFMRTWSIGGETPIVVKPFSLKALYK